jgi:hypothetical protein
MARRPLKQQPDKPLRPANGEDRVAFTAELPGADPKRPLWQLGVEWAERNEGDGERLRLRVHIRTTLAEALARGSRQESLSAPVSGGGLVPSVTRGISRAIMRGLEMPVVRQLAAPLLEHDINTWIDLQISTAALDGGTRELLPAPEQLARLGITPRKDGDAPVVESWSGASSGPKPGMAQVSLLRLAKEQLPASLAAMLGAKPFQLAAAIVNVIEEHR